MRNSSRRQRLTTDKLMVEYVLERLLYRLATSPAGREHFVLKGGLLLAQFGARRTTRDIDILGQAFTGDETEIIRRVTTIAETEVDDGVAFDGASIRTAPIREDGRYHGLRLVMPASIARAQLKSQLDVSVGDPSPPRPNPWLRRQGPAATGYPTSFADTVAVITAFADPRISGEARGRHWDPDNARWT